jgi:hypothetical protein
VLLNFEAPVLPGKRTKADIAPAEEIWLTNLFK